MFRKATLFFGILLGLLCLVWGICIGAVRSHDVQAMKQQIQNQKMAKSATLFSATEQKRKGVVKEIWFSQENNERLHHRICSDSSVLMIVPQGNKSGDQTAF